MAHTDPNRLSIKFLIFLLLVAVWRELSKFPAVQAPLHRVLKKGAVAVQWYTVLFVGLVVFAAISTVAFIKDGLYVSFSPETREENLRHVFENAHFENRTFEQFEAETGVGPFLTILNMFGQFAGLLVIAISGFHCIVLLVIPSQHKAIEHEHYQSYTWSVPKRVNWLLWILTLPAVFSIEVLLANINLWGIINGCHYSYHEASWNYAEARSLEFLYVKESIQIATLFQFTAVWAFTRLTSSLLTDTSLMRDSDEEKRNIAKEYKRLIRNGGFLGIWLYVIAGSLRAVIVIIICTYLQFAILTKEDMDDSHVTWLEDVEEAFNAAIGLTFAVLTILTVINMWVMTRTTIISKKLGDTAKGEYDANKKFIGVRLLLICSEVIPKVIDFLEIGTPQFKQVEKLTTPHFSFLHMDAEEAEILKNTILSFACLLAAIMNFIFWRSLDIEKAGLLDFTATAGDRCCGNKKNSNNFNGEDSVDEDADSLLFGLDGTPLRA